MLFHTVHYVVRYNQKKKTVSIDRRQMYVKLRKCQEKISIHQLIGLFIYATVANGSFQERPKNWTISDSYVRESN